MISRRSKPNAILIELVIVLLFFSLSAAVILQLFMAAHEKSVRGDVNSEALMMAEDLADRFYVSPLEAQAFFAQDGWSAADGGFEKVGEAGSRSLRFAISGETRDTQVGALDDYLLAVYDGEMEIVALPVLRYAPREVTP